MLVFQELMSFQIVQLQNYEQINEKEGTAAANSWLHMTMTSVLPL